MDNFNEVLADDRGKQSDNPGWEINLGVKWFSRAGIAILLVGCAMGFNDSFPYLNHLLTPEIKLLLGAGLALLLFLCGSRIHEKFPLLGRILQGGGFSLGYLTLFGMFFIPAVQLFAAPQLQSIGWGLLLLYVGGMLAFSHRMGSRTIAFLSLAFGYYTATYSGAQLPGLLSAGMLSLAAAAASRWRGAILIPAHQDQASEQDVFEEETAKPSAPSWEGFLFVGLGGGLLTCLYWHLFGSEGAFAIQNAQGGLAKLGLNTLLGLREDMFCFLFFNVLLFHLANFWRNRPKLGFSMLNGMLSYSAFLMINGGWGLIPAGMAEGLMAALFLFSFVFKSEPHEIRTEQLLLSAFFSLMATMGLLGAEMKPIAFSLQAILFSLLNRKSAHQREIKRNTALSVLFLGIAFASLGFFNWGLLSAPVLLIVVGTATLTAMILERSFPMETFARIALLLISSLTFLAALMVGLHSYGITLSIVLTGFFFLMGGFLIRRNTYRWMGLCWIFLAAFRLFTVDLITLRTPYQIVLFMVVGLTLLAGSYGYNLLQRRMNALPDIAGDMPDQTTPIQE